MFIQSIRTRLITTTGQTFVFAMSMMIPGMLFANPTGGNLVAGAATITNGTGVTTITQTSGRAIIDWQGFSIGSGELTKFVQPSATAAMLNRVISGDASTILGSLQSNGKVYLINPNGVLIGSGARIDTGGFLASTLDVANNQFLAAGDLNFSGASTAAVVNLGAISAASGDIYLIAQKVDNEGTLSARTGTAGLAAGSQILLTTAGPEHLYVQAGTAPGTVVNAGQIAAATAELKAANGNPYQLAINNTGIVQATGTAMVNGQVWLVGGLERPTSNAQPSTSNSQPSLSGTVSSAGAISAVNASGAGGTIELTGQSINVASGAMLDASARSATGQGGQIQVIADKTVGDLMFHGQASARGGSVAGDGGSVETSGATVDFTGARIDTSAVQGATGTWLIDPYDLTVDSAAASTINTNLLTTSVTLQTEASSSSGVGMVNTNGNGDIFINSALSWSGNTTLTLDAYRNININAAITASGAGNVVLITGDTTGNGQSSSATGDYYFGLVGTTFAGSLNFTGGSGSGATLNIGTDGDNIAPTSYTILYSLATPLTTSGKFAFATNITDSGTRTTAVYVSSNNIVYTGLGHTVSALNISNTATGAYGLFGTVAGATPVIRDIGVSGTVNVSNSEQAGGLIGTIGTSTVKDTYSTVNVTGTGVGTGVNIGIGGLIGAATNTTNITNSTATGAVTGQNHVGGLIGALNGSGGSVTNSHATGVITSSGEGMGGLIGDLAGTETITNSYATGSVTGNNTIVPNIAAAGGLVGLSGGTMNIINSYATGNVSAPGSSVGGLIGSSATNMTITDSYATGSATTAQNQVGGLVGGASSTLIVNNSYATGDVSATGSSSSSAGGLIGLASTLVVNTSFATGTVTAFSSAGGLIGNIMASGTLKDVYANGSVRATSTTATQGAGGLIALAASTTVTNGYSSGTLSGPVGGTGAVIGRTSGTFTATNVYWDSTRDTSTNIGSGAGTFNFNPTGPSTGALSTTTLQNGALMGGFNTTVGGTDLNGTPWHTGNGLYLYLPLPGYVPANSQTISGYAFGADGVTPVGSANITLYFSGGVLASGVTADASTGFYDTFVGANTINANSKLAGTLGLSASPSVVAGAAYTDAPSLSGGNVVNFNLQSGLFKISTTEATSMALASSLTSTFTANTYNTLSTSALDNANWLINAANAFSIDSALSHAGQIQLQSGSALSIVSGGSVTSTGSGVILAANGNFINNGGASAISASSQWQVYSQASNSPTSLPTFAVAGGLAGTNYYGDAYNFTIGAFASAPSGGNRFIYGYQPSLTVTPDTKSVVYNGGIQTDSYSLSGYVSAADQSADSFTGSVSGLTTSSKNVGAYTLTSGGNLTSGENYAITYSGNGTLSITQAQLIISTGNVNKTYDGNTSVTGGSAVAVGDTKLFGNDTLSNGTFAYTTKGAGSGTKVVTVSNVTVNDGNSGSNYAVTYGNNTTSTITPAPLTISGITAGNRTYDGTTVASINTGGIVFTGLVGNETVTVASTGTFANKNVGTGKTVTLASTYGGADASNYTINGQAATTANITQAALILSTGNVSKTYNGNTSVTGGSAVAVGGTTLLGNDTLNGGTFAYTTKSVGTGTKTVTVSGVSVSDGNGGSNYMVTYGNNTTSTITPAPLTISGITGNNRAYDGTTAATADTSGAVLDGLVSGDVVTVSATGTFDSRNVGGNKTVMLSSTYGGAEASDYTITGQAKTTANITAAPLTISTVNVSKTYDGSTAVTGGNATVVSGTLFGNDTLSDGTFAYATKDAGSGTKVVTVSNVTVNDGNGGSNYGVSYGNNTTSTITPAPLTLSASKTYDGTTTLTSADVTLGGLVGNETLTITGNTTAASANVANNTTNSISAITLDDATDRSGGLASNYQLPDLTAQSASNTVTINSKALTYSVGNASTTYGTLATLGNATLTGIVNNDTVTTTVGAFSGNTAVTLAATTNAGNYTETVTALSNSNYSIATGGNTNGTLTVNAKTVTLSASKTYDGTTALTSADVTLGGLVGNETLTINGNATASSANVADNATNSISTITLGNATDGSGGLASNYQVPNLATQSASNKVTINPKALTYSVGNTSATYGTLATLGNATLTGIVNNDTVTTTVGAFSGNTAVTLAATTNAGNYTEAVTALSNSNYSIATGGNTNGTLTVNAKAVTLSASKTYDGTTALTSADVTLGGLVGNETLTLTGNTTAASANVADNSTNSLTSASGLTLADGTGTNAGAASNYQLPVLDHDNAPVTINAEALVVTPVGNQSKTYGDTDTALIYGVTTGTLYNGDTPSGNLTYDTAGQYANAGTHAITQGTLAAPSSNYELSFASTPVDFTINQATLTITAGDASRYYGAANPAFTANYTGLLGTDTSAAVSGLTLTTSATTASPTGNYTITPVGATATNYTISFVPGTLTVLQSYLKVGHKNLPVLLRDGVPVETDSYAVVTEDGRLTLVKLTGASTGAPNSLEKEIQTSANNAADWKPSQTTSVTRKNFDFGQTSGTGRLSGSAGAAGNLAAWIDVSSLDATNH